jgi:hypothetical protein
LYASTLANTTGPDKLRTSGGNSAKNPLMMDERMVLVAESEGGGMASIVK